MRGINENTPIPDTFCSGIGAIEHLEGNNLRFYLYVSQDSDDGGTKERVLVAKIVAHASVVPDAVLQMMAAIGNRVLKVVPLIDDLVH